MGVYIPNMSKPKSCWECFNADCDHWGEHGYDNTADCPLIEIDDEAIDIAQDIIDGCKELKERVDKGIVRCGECAWYEKPYCRWHQIDNEPTDFCSYGERRAE